LDKTFESIEAFDLLPESERDLPVVAPVRLTLVFKLSSVICPPVFRRPPSLCSRAEGDIFQKSYLLIFERNHSLRPSRLD